MKKPLKIGKREVVTVKIADLKPAKYNPRKISDHDYMRLHDSMNRDGLLQTILINKDNTVIAGHQRLKVAEDLGWEDMTAIKINVNKIREKELNLHMNRNQGEFVDEMLAGVIGEIASDPSGDLKRSGFTDSEITAFLDANKSELGPEVDDTQDAQDAARRNVHVKSGSVYQLGPHRLMCGNATSPEDVAKLMDGEKAQLLHTDPPYNVAYKYTEGKYSHDGGLENDNLDPESYRAFVKAYLQNAIDHTADNAVFYNWLADKYADMFKSAQEELGLTWRQNVIWLKESPTFGLGRMYMRCFEMCMLTAKKGQPYFNGYTADFRDVITRMSLKQFVDQLDVWYAHRDNTTDYVHPTQKPVYLAQRAMQKNSQPGDIVLDLFGGSGSTLIAADYLGRNCYTMELDPFYAEVIKNRYELWEKEKRESDEQTT